VTIGFLAGLTARARSPRRCGQLPLQLGKKGPPTGRVNQICCGMPVDTVTRRDIAARLVAITREHGARSPVVGARPRRRGDRIKATAFAAIHESGLAILPSSLPTMNGTRAVRSTYGTCVNVTAVLTTCDEHPR
jgi:hypothetical protein